MAPDFFTVVRNTAHRRIWLLTKALEHAPLAEALILAQAAEDFVTTAADPAARWSPPGAHGASPRAH